MPIYDYEGQRYNIPTDDPAVAKQKILAHLGRAEAPVEEKPVGKPAEAPVEEGKGNLGTDILKGLGAVGTSIASSLPSVVGARERVAAREVPTAPLNIAESLFTGNILDKIQEHYGFKKKEQKAPETPVAEGFQYLQEKFNKPLQQASDLAASELYIPGARTIAEKGREVSKDLMQSMTPESREAIAKSQIGTPEFLGGEGFIGEDASARGLGLQFLNVAASVAPLLVAGVVTKDPNKVAALGQAMSTGEGMNAAIEYIGSLSDEELARRSPEFVQLVSQYGPQEARRLLVSKVADQAGVAQGVVGRFGGQILGKLFAGQFDDAILKTFKTRAGAILGTGTLVAGQQGVEEMAEGLASDIGIDKSVVKEVGADAFANMVWGALGGKPLGMVQGARAKLDTGTTGTKEEPAFVTDPKTGNLVPADSLKTEAPEATTAAPLTKQGDLFTLEQAPYQVTPGDVNVEAQARQEQSDRAQEQIAVLTERLASATDPQEVATIRDDISKLEPLVEQTGQQKAISLGNEIVTLQRKRQALTERVTALEAERDAEKSLDGKKLITEEIKAIENQVSQITARQEAILAEGEKLKKEGVTFDKSKDELDLKGPSPIVNKKVLAKFGLAPKAPIRQELLNLDMTDPADRQKFIDAVDKHTIKKAKIDMAAVESYLNAFEAPVQQEVLNEPGSVSDTGTGTSEPSVSVPSGQAGTTEGTAALAAQGLGSTVPTTGGPVAGTGAVPSTGTGALTQATAPTPTPTPTPPAATVTDEGKEILARLNVTGGMPPKPSFKFKFPSFKRETRQLNDDYQQNSVFAELKAGFANMFSFDDAYNSLVRKELLRLSDEGKISQEEALLALRRVDVTQVVHRGQLATETINTGKLEYDPVTNRYRIEADQVNMENLKKQIVALSERTGISIDEALAVVSKAIEANRVRDVYEKLDKITGDITRTEKKIDALQANRKRTKDEDKQLAQARELIKKLKDEQELNRDRVQHMTRKQVQEGMKDFNNLPETKEAFAVWMEMRKRVVEELVRSGVTSESKAERWLAEMAYVPFFRDVGEQRGLGLQIMKKGLGESMAEYGFKGSMLPVENVIGNMYQWMHWSYARSISNQHLRVALDQLKAVYPEMVREGAGPKGSTFSVYVDGQRKQYHVANVAVAKMFIETGSVLFPSVTLGKKYVELFVKGITRIPGFSTSQLILKDTWEAASTSGVKNPYGVIKNVFFEIGKTALGISEARKELKARGVLSTREHAMASEYSTEVSQRLELKDPSYYRMAMNALDKFSALNDNMLRQAVYQQLISEGKTKDEAADRSTEIFNYRRSSGSSLVQTLTNFVPFLNAFAISGRVAFRTVSGKGITAQTRLEGAKTLATTQTLLIAGTLIYLMAAGDSEEYKRMNRLQRDTSFVIPGTGMAIPIRNGWFAMNKITAEYIYNLLVNEATTDPQMFRDALYKAFKKQFEPPIGGVVVAPIGLALNKDIFNNKDIVNKTLDGLESEYQMDKNTSELSKYIGSISGMSPLKLDYFFNAFFGMAMPATAWLTNDLIADARGIPRPSQTAVESLAKVPTVGQFIAKEDKSGSAADFYAAARESDKSLRSIKKLAETDLGAAQTKLEEDRDKIQYTEGIKRALENLNRRENIIRNTPAFTTIDGKRAPNTLVLDGEEVPVTSENKAKLIKQIEEERKSLTKDIVMVRKQVFK